MIVCVLLPSPCMHIVQWPQPILGATPTRWPTAKPFEVHGVSLDLTASGDGALLLPELVLRETSPTRGGNIGAA